MRQEGGGASSIARIDRMKYDKGSDQQRLSEKLNGHYRRGDRLLGPTGSLRSQNPPCFSVRAIARARIVNPTCGFVSIITPSNSLCIRAPYAVSVTLGELEREAGGAFSRIFVDFN